MTITWQHCVIFCLGIVGGHIIGQVLWFRWVEPWLRRPRVPVGPVSVDPQLRALGLPARGPGEEWDGGEIGDGSCMECTELCSICRPADDPLAAGRPKEAEGWEWCWHGAQGACPFSKQERYAALQEARPLSALDAEIQAYLDMALPPEKGADS